MLQEGAGGTVDGGIGSEMGERMTAVEKRVDKMGERLDRLEGELLHARMESC